jgi:hypothetical protein
MSVALIRKSELENIAGSLDKHLRESGFQTWSEYEKRDAYRAIAVAGIANQTAAFLTYGSDSEFGTGEDIRDLDDTQPGTLDAKETYQRIRSLIYNCISNDGTECLPARYSELLEDMLRSMIEKAAGWKR